jgi:hypothetical protein
LHDGQLLFEEGDLLISCSFRARPLSRTGRKLREENEAKLKAKEQWRWRKTPRQVRTFPRQPVHALDVAAQSAERLVRHVEPPGSATSRRRGDGRFTRGASDLKAANRGVVIRLRNPAL